MLPGGASRVADDTHENRQTNKQTNQTKQKTHRSPEPGPQSQRAQELNKPLGTRSLWYIKKRKYLSFMLTIRLYAWYKRSSKVPSTASTSQSKLDTAHITGAFQAMAQWISAEAGALSVQQGTVLWVTSTDASGDWAYARVLQGRETVEVEN